MRMNPRSYHLPEKFLVASIVVRMAPCNREEKAVWGRGGQRSGERTDRDGRGWGRRGRGSIQTQKPSEAPCPPFLPPHCPKTIPASWEKGEAEVS